MSSNPAMAKKKAEKLEIALLITILLLGLLPRLVFLFRGPYTIIRILPDDCFYYLKTSQYIAAGVGSTFDGLHLTNGYHPLWMLIMTPLAFFLHNPLALLKTALGLGILASLLSTLVLYKLLKKITHIWWIPLFGCSLYFYNAQAMANSMDVLGTAVSTLLFISALYLTISQLINKDKAKGYILILGIVLGLLFLARTDNVFYIITFFLLTIIRQKKESRLRSGLTLAGMIAIICGPWFIWSWLRFGSLMQSQGLALPFLRQQTYLLSGKNYLQMFLYGLWYFFSFLFKGIPHDLGSSSPFIPAAIFTLCLLVISFRWRDPELEQTQLIHNSIKVTLVLYLGGLCLIFSHTFWRWFPRIWYFDQLIILSAFFLGLALVVLDGKRVLPRLVNFFYPQAETANIFLRAVMAVVMIILMLLPLLRGSERLIKGDYSWQVEMLDAAYWLKNNSKKEETAAAFNAGIISFFSERRVVNLDGAINNAAYAALKKKDLLNMMYKSGVNYYLDYDPAMLSWYLPFLGKMKERVKMSPVKEFSRPEGTWCSSHLKIYRLEWLE
jgi:hypothetical protein